MSLEAVLVDVGFTLVVCDGEEIAASARRLNVQVEPRAIDNAMRPLYSELRGYSWPTHPGSSATTVAGSPFFQRLLELAGARGNISAAAERLWNEHLERNLWRKLLPGARDALVALRNTGLRLAAVSNSEGTVERLLVELGLRPLFEAVVDSWEVGFSKPDPRIFEVALSRMAISADRAIMVGDSWSSDVEGARQAGIKSVLIDQYDLHPDATVPRYRSFADFARALLDKGTPGASGA